MLPATCRLADHIPPSQPYDVEDVLVDMIGAHWSWHTATPGSCSYAALPQSWLRKRFEWVAAWPSCCPPLTSESKQPFSHSTSKTLSRYSGFRQLNRCPASLDSFRLSQLPQHPCLELVAVSEQFLRPGFSRWLITMRKTAPYSQDFKVGSCRNLASHSR